MTVKPNKLEEKIIHKNRFQIAEENAKKRIEQLHKLAEINFSYTLEVPSKTDLDQLKKIANAVIELINEQVDSGKIELGKINTFKYYDKTR
jgi:hypothetical protein